MSTKDLKSSDHNIPDPRDIYRLALRYSEASAILQAQASDQGWGASAPRLLVDSFAIELYLKCLFVLDHGSKPKKGHNWVTLFEELSPQTRKIIREQFDSIVAADPILRNLHLINPDALKVTDFDRSLKAAGGTFERRRYLYETPANDEWYYAHLLHDAIRTVTSLDLRLSDIRAQHYSATPGSHSS